MIRRAFLKLFAAVPLAPLVAKVKPTPCLHANVGPPWYYCDQCGMSKVDILRQHGFFGPPTPEQQKAYDAINWIADNFDALKRGDGSVYRERAAGHEAGV